MNAYITIGNSDDKLSQSEWSQFCKDLEFIAAGVERTRWGTWYSAPDAPWQNMCVCISMHVDYLGALRGNLASIAKKWRQDTIALALVAETELVEAWSI